MKIEIHKLKHMFLFIPTIGMDAEYRCLFFVWLNRAIYLGKGKEIKDIQQDYKENGCNFDGDIDFIARHFANWQKEQMMKDAVDAEASYTMSVPSILISLPIGIKVGDTVKVIIVKQENKNE